MRSKTRPIIGIPCRYNWESYYYELRETYSAAIYAAGGSPLMIPLIAKAEYIESVVEHLDGVCLSGAVNDVDPLRYGREPHRGLGPVIFRRDETDMLLLSAAEARGLPVLAICFGIQSLNVYRGGTLIQDIDTEVKGGLKHMQAGEIARGSHTINVTETSLIAELAGATSVAVNSHHHQCIDIAGRDLEPIAWAADGVIEAVFNTRPGQFILGVQWHPEISWDSDPLSRAIFERFVAVASDYASTSRLNEPAFLDAKP